MDEFALNQPKTEDIEIEHICRICLQSEDELYLIFDEKYVNNGVQLTRMIKECASCDVIRYDNYPHQICKKCLDTVYIAYNFRKQCQNSHMLVKLFLDKADPANNVSENLAPLEKATQTQSYLSYPCEKCDEKFWTFDELSDHNFYNHRGTPNVCKICKQVFKRPGYLRDHLSSKHPETGVRSRNQCKICFKKFSQAGHLQRHLIQVHKCKEIQKYMEDRFESKTKLKIEENEIKSKNLKKNLQQTEKTSLTTVENKPRLCSAGLNEADLKFNFDIDNNWTENDKNASTDDEDSFPLALFKIKSGDEDEENEDGANADEANDNIEIDLVEKIDLAIDSVFNADLQPEEVILNKNCKFDQLNGRKSSRIKKSCSKNITEDTTNQNTKKLKCNQCDKIFPYPAYLKRHEISHLNKKRYNCTICARQFASEEYLKLHLENMHSNQRVFECKKCLKSFPVEWHLRMHNKNCRKIADKFSCSFENCTETFNTVRYLNVHIKKNHPSEKQTWSCRYCQQKFGSRGEIQKHSKIHDDEKPHLCNECGKKFSEVNHLNLHIMRHRGEKRLKCKYCEKRFIRSSDLHVHEMYHTGVKPHTCETCGKGFIRACTLRIHVRTHTGEKPYKCSYCDRSFAQKQDMTAHVRRLHTGERYNCPMCSEGYVHLYQLTQHKKSVHGIDEPSHIQRLSKINVDVECEQKNEK